MMTTTPPHGAAAALRGRAQRRDYLPILHDICAPTLVLVGREDFYAPPPFAEQLVSGIKGAKLLVVEGAGHMPNLERPEVVNCSISLWLKELGQAAG